MNRFDIIINDYFNNANDIIGCLPISFEEYIQFVFPGHLQENNYIYDKEKHNLLFQKVANGLSIKAANIIHKAGIAFSYEKASKKNLFINPMNHIDAIRYSYDKICSLPKDILTEALGSGISGIVLSFDKNKVIKVLYNKLSSNEYLLYEYQQKKCLSIFPFIYYFDEDVVIMEKLITKTEKCSRFERYIEKYVIINFIEEISYRSLNTDNEFMPQEFSEFVRNIRTALNTIFEIDCIGDLKLENIGERPLTGEIVMFDPVGGYIENYERIILNSRH